MHKKVNNNNNNNTLKHKYTIFMLTVLLVISIPLGILYEIHSNEIVRDDAPNSIKSKQWKDLLKTTKVKVILKALISG